MNQRSQAPWSTASAGDGPDDYRHATVPFQTPTLSRSLLQLATSFGGFCVTCAVMYLCLEVSHWIALPLSLLAAGFLIRIFIIQHDCGHCSFFRLRTDNAIICRQCSVITSIPL